MEHCRRLSGSVNVDFPPQKLRPGYGTFVTELLHDLAEAALKVRTVLPRTFQAPRIVDLNLIKSKSHKFRKPEYPTESDDTEQAIEESDPEVDMEDDVDGDYSGLDKPFFGSATVAPVSDCHRTATHPKYRR